MKGWMRVLLLLGLIAGVVGCERREEAKKQAPVKTGNVVASAAYVTYFGEPPTVAEGSCYALVGYYPLADNPGKVRPFPLFMFNRENQLQVVTEQLLHWGEGWDMGGVAVNPFPAGTGLLSLSREQDLVRLELSPEVLSAGDREMRLILAALGHTLVQFEGVRRVMVVAGGELLPFQTGGGFIPDPAAVVPPGTPTVLSVVGVWKRGDAEPEEVSVFFDRPVTVRGIRVANDGRPLAGEFFRSVFDMAVVIRPKDPQTVREGMPVKVAWEVEDHLGRKGKGEKVFVLGRVEHQ